MNEKKRVFVPKKNGGGSGECPAEPDFVRAHAHSRFCLTFVVRHFAKRSAPHSIRDFA